MSGNQPHSHSLPPFPGLLVPGGKTGVQPSWVAGEPLHLFLKVWVGLDTLPPPGERPQPDLLPPLGKAVPLSNLPLPPSPSPLGGRFFLEVRK